MKNKTLVVLVVVLIAAAGAYLTWFADDNPTSDAGFDPGDAALRYSFFVAGHVYHETSDTTEQVNPSFATAFDEINDDPSILFGFLTGDMVYVASDENYDALESTLSLLDAEIHFVAGNHEMRNRALFESRFGRSYYTFTYEGDIFVVLDGMLDGWQIRGEQLEMLHNAINSSEPDAQIFIFVHQYLWHDPAGHAFTAETEPNSEEGRAGMPNIWEEIIPWLQDRGGQTYIFAGDVGSRPNQASFQYKRFGNLHLTISGMGGGTSDNFVIVRVYRGGMATVSPVWLERDLMLRLKYPVIRFLRSVKDSF